MTILKITVEDEQAELLKKILIEVSFVKKIEEELIPTDEKLVQQQSLARIKKMLDDAKGENLFQEIEDPSEWQRQIRKEWERDF